MTAPAAPACPVKVRQILAVKVRLGKGRKKTRRMLCRPGLATLAMTASAAGLDCLKVDTLASGSTTDAAAPCAANSIRSGNSLSWPPVKVSLAPRRCDAAHRKSSVSPESAGGTDGGGADGGAEYADWAASSSG
eukprot:scaffold29615_cov81-Isochrysis_galbana.AAC.1